MFTTLSATPQRMHTAAPVTVLPARWRTVAAPPRLVALSPGVWIARARQWRSPEQAQDQPAPPVLDVDAQLRVMPFLAWHGRASCLHADPEVFFGDDTEVNALPLTAVEAARAMCRVCPVMRTCLNWALTARNEQADGFVTTGEQYGIWGGTTGRQRRVLRERLRRGATVRELVDECLATM